MLRHDIGEFVEPEITAQGYLKADAFVTRAGVFTYKLIDGTIQNELRPAEEVFSKDSLASLAGLIVTDDHPEVMVDSHNTRNYQVGFTGEKSKKDDGFVKSKLTITDKNVIDKVLKDGKTEISSGYTTDLDFTPGIFEGLKYDAIQRNIRYNHIAIVDRGRAGPQVRLKLSKFDAEMVSSKSEKQKVDSQQVNKVKSKKSNFSKEEKGVKSMEIVKMKIDAIEHEVPAGLAAVVKTKLNSLSESESKIDKLQGAHDALKVLVEKKDLEIKAVQEKLDAGSDKKELIKIARERIAMEDFSSKILGDEVKIDSEMSDIELKKLVLAKGQPSLELKEKKDSYVEAAFDIFKNDRKEKQAEDKKDSDKSDDFKKSLSKEDSKDSQSADAAKAKYKEDSEAAWTKDLN